MLISSAFTRWGPASIPKKPRVKHLLLLGLEWMIVEGTLNSHAKQMHMEWDKTLELESELAAVLRRSSVAAFDNRASAMCSKSKMFSWLISSSAVKCSKLNPVAQTILETIVIMQNIILWIRFNALLPSLLSRDTMPKPSIPCKFRMHCIQDEISPECCWFVQSIFWWWNIKFQSRCTDKPLICGIIEELLSADSKRGALECILKLHPLMFSSSSSSIGNMEFTPSVALERISRMSPSIRIPLVATSNLDGLLR